MMICQLPYEYVKEVLPDVIQVFPSSILFSIIVHLVFDRWCAISLQSYIFLNVQEEGTHLHPVQQIPNHLVHHHLRLEDIRLIYWIR
jgi:uncharacterized protein YjaZ